MAAPVCTKVSLVDNAVCYLVPTLSPAQQKALLIYAKALELAAIGGTNYLTTLTTTLVSAAATMTCGMGQAERDAARVNLVFLNAATAGAEVPPTLAAKVLVAKCLSELDEEALDSVDLLLTCRLGVHKAYVQ